MPLHPALKGPSFPLLTPQCASSATFGQEVTEKQQELEGPMCDLQSEGSN